MIYSTIHLVILCGLSIVDEFYKCREFQENSTGITTMCCCFKTLSIWFRDANQFYLSRHIVINLFIKIIIHLLIHLVWWLNIIHETFRRIEHFTKSFLLTVSLVNVTKSAGNCRFGHIYWRNPSWKTSSLCSAGTMFWTFYKHSGWRNYLLFRGDLEVNLITYILTVDLVKKSLYHQIWTMILLK